MVKTRERDQTKASVESRTVVIAAGLQRVPKFPQVHSKLPEDVLQLHTADYRNPQSLPPGAVSTPLRIERGVRVRRIANNP